VRRSLDTLWRAVLDGLGMLVNQGVIGFRLWTGRDPKPGGDAASTGRGILTKADGDRAKRFARREQDQNPVPSLEGF